MTKAEFYASTVRKHREARAVHMALARLGRGVELTKTNPAEAVRHAEKALRSLSRAAGKPSVRIAAARDAHKAMLANLRVLNKLAEGTK